MKTLKLALTLAALCTASAPYSKAQVEKQSRPDVNKASVPYSELTCRGGAGLRFVVTEGRTNSSGEQTMSMVVTFQRAVQPADAAGHNLQPGQCAFPERAARADEPNQIFQDIVRFGQSQQQLYGIPVDNSPTAAERYPDAQNVPRYLADTQHYWSFFVRQTGPLLFWFEAADGHYWHPPKMIPDVLKAGSRSRVNGAGADELNPQPLPPCEKCPEVRKTPTEVKKKPR